MDDHMDALRARVAALEGELSKWESILWEARDKLDDGAPSLDVARYLERAAGKLMSPAAPAKGEEAKPC